MCGAPAQDADLAGVDLSTETVITGKVLAHGSPVPQAYVRLLDGTGEFTAEVVSSATGDFRFFAAPGTWKVRALSRQGTGETSLEARIGVTDTEISVSA